ncbi:MAG: MJ0042-type zinc finger domain-containing protein [Alphaproteobacteria bacterium]
MIVSCPTCSTRYTLSDESLGTDGRKVRCARCGHTWWQKPERADPDPVVPDAPTEIRPAKSAEKAAGKSRSKPPKAQRAKPARSTVIGFALLAALVAGTVAGGYLGRDAIVRGWPPAALFYGTIGMQAESPGFGLELRNIRSEQKLEGGKTILLLDGEIANTTDVERALPQLRAITFGAEHKPLQSWTIEPSAPVLAPGAVASFHHSQPDPGPVTEVTITFGGPPPGLEASAPEKPAEKSAEKPAEKAAEKSAAAKPAAPAKPSGH